MLDEFAGIDPRSEALPIVCIFQSTLVCGEARWLPKRASALAAIHLLQLQSRRDYPKRNGNVFGALVSEIKKSNYKVGNVDRSAAMAELQDIRDSIDNIDASIIHMLAERFRCTQKVGVLKARHNLPPSDPGREAQQVTRLRELASAAKLDPEFAEKFLAFVIREVIRHHETARR
jgi:chorismate mutase